MDGIFYDNKKLYLVEVKAHTGEIKSNGERGVAKDIKKCMFEIPKRLQKQLATA